MFLQQKHPPDADGKVQIRYHHAVAQAKEALQKLTGHPRALATWYGAVIRRDPAVSLPNDHELLILRACQESGLTPTDWNEISRFPAGPIALTFHTATPEAAAAAWAAVTTFPGDSELPTNACIDIAAKQMSALDHTGALTSYEPVLHSFYLHSVDYTRAGLKPDQLVAHSMIEETRHHKLVKAAPKQIQAVLKYAQNRLKESPGETLPQLGWEMWLFLADTPTQVHSKRTRAPRRATPHQRRTADGTPAGPGGPRNTHRTPATVGPLEDLAPHRPARPRETPARDRDRTEKARLDRASHQSAPGRPGPHHPQSRVQKGRTHAAVPAGPGRSRRTAPDVPRPHHKVRKTPGVGSKDGPAPHQRRGQRGCNCRAPLDVPDQIATRTARHLREDPAHRDQLHPGGFPDNFLLEPRDRGTTDTTRKTGNRPSPRGIDSQTLPGNHAPLARAARRMLEQNR